jgi:equilibrative nucleoside transporter 1/2/3
METRTTIDRMLALFRKSDVEQDYEPLGTDASTIDGDVRRPALVLPEDDEEPFSWFEYCVFLLLGIAMLWAW